MPTTEDLPELVDVRVRVESVPRTELVHVDVVGAGGLVLHVDEAEALSRDLRRVTREVRSRGRAGAGAARRAASGSAHRL